MTNTHITHTAGAERNTGTVARIAVAGTCVLVVLASWMLLMLVLLETFSYPRFR